MEIYFSRDYIKGEIMKNILVILGHPRKQSFCGSIAKAYCEEASKNASVKQVNLIDLRFDLNYMYREQKLELDLIKMQTHIAAADVIVFVYPLYWGNYPALVKGFFDRVLSPGFAFEYINNTPKGLLHNKKITLIQTCDMPKWAYILTGKLNVRLFKYSISKFIGIKKVKDLTLSPIHGSTELQRLQWLNKVRKLAEKDSKS